MLRLRLGDVFALSLISLYTLIFFVLKHIKIHVFLIQPLSDSQNVVIALLCIVVIGMCAHIAWSHGRAACIVFLMAVGFALLGVGASLPQHHLGTYLALVIAVSVAIGIPAIHHASVYFLAYQRELRESKSIPPSER